MKAIEIVLNGKKQCVAGITDGTVVAQIFCAGARSRFKYPRSEGHTGFWISGLDSKRDESLEWMERDLVAGDKIILRIVDTLKADPPKKRSPMGGDRSAKGAMVRRLAEELGWSIRTT